MQIRSAGQFQLRLYPPDIDKLGQRASSRYFIRVVKTAGIGKWQAVFTFQIEIESSPYIVRKAYIIIPVILPNIVRAIVYSRSGNHFLFLASMIISGRIRDISRVILPDIRKVRLTGWRKEITLLTRQRDFPLQHVFQRFVIFYYDIDGCTFHAKPGRRAIHHIYLFYFGWRCGFQ